MTIFVRVLDGAVEKRASALLQAVVETRAGAKAATTFERAPEAFVAVPGSPFAYWVSEAVRGTFTRHPRLEQHYTATRGAYTTDDFKYYRLTWEAPATARANTRKESLGRRAYVPLAKGGAFSTYYADIHLVVRWHDDGADAKAFLSAYRERKGWGTDWSACLNGYSEYFRPGLTWSRRSQVGLSLRVLPKGCIFGDKGPVAFVADDPSDSLLALLAVTNSGAFRALVALQMAFGSYEVGVIQRTPIPQLTPPDVRTLAKLARRSWSLKRELDMNSETSLAFLLPSVAHKLDRSAIERELESLQKQIDDEVFRLYGIGTDDRTAAEMPAPRGASNTPDADESDDGGDDSGDEDPEGYAGTSDTFVSWLVGVAFARFDPRLATGERVPPPEPEPFDPLPSRSPGMYPEGEAPTDRPDILVDDEGHADDLAARAQGVAERVRIAPRENLRAWLAKEFFHPHIKMYSKSRRKAPIYWQLATPSATYSVWLYIHAFSKDTLFRVQNEYVAPKLAHEERRLESMMHELRDQATAALRKELAAQESFVEELRELLEEVKHVAPLWHPDLDDGVIINFAPLWRLVPHHKPWQKELKSTWDALCDAQYDWAHLAMHLWPERVVPKCSTDRSLAIAHGLEDVFWIAGSDGKWTPRKTPTRTIDELVRERTSPAVKAALKSLLEAPTPTGTAKKTRKGRARA